MNALRQESPSYEETPFLDRKREEELSIKQILTRNETFLAELRSQRDADVSRQNELLEEIRDVLASQLPSRLQFISETLLQMVLVAAAILFGMFSIWSCILQFDGVVQNMMQNGMALVAFCEGNNSSAYAVPCDLIQRNGPGTMARFAQRLFDEQSFGPPNSTWGWQNVFDNAFTSWVQTYNYTIASGPPLTFFCGFILSWLLYRQKFPQEQNNKAFWTKVFRRQRSKVEEATF